MRHPRSILVRYLATPQAFDTALGAINALKGTPRDERARLDSVKIAGLMITQFAYDAGQLHLCLSNGETLEVIVVQDKVEWHLVKSTPLADASLFTKPEAMNLQSGNGEDFLFEPASLLGNRLSFPLSKLFGGDYFLNIYFKRGGVLRFSPLWNESDMTPLLYFSELEPIPVPGEPLPVWLLPKNL